MFRAKDHELLINSMVLQQNLIIWMILKLIILAIFSLTGGCDVLTFSEAIADNILTKNESYLVFVSLKDTKTQELFEMYCENRINCTILETSNELFEQFTIFVGYQEGQYLLIIDAFEFLKFICPIEQGLTQSNMRQFEEKYHKGELSPFYASQPLIEGKIDEKCMKLVGKSYEDFLVKDQPVKIVYLYTELPFCQACKDLLKRYKRLSRKYFQTNVIRFGYIDILKNDNRFIKDEIMPYFLVYMRDNFDDPYGIGAEQFDELQGYVQQLISDVNSSRYVQPESEQVIDL